MKGLTKKVKIRCPKFIRKLFFPITNLWHMAWSKIRKSIRLELVTIFGICLLLSTIVGSITDDFFRDRSRYARIDYTGSTDRIVNQASNIVDHITNLKISIADKVAIEQALSNFSQNRNLKTIISDLDGKVLYKSNNANETQVDIYSTIKNAMEGSRDREEARVSESKEYISFYPINFTDSKGYVIVSGIPEGQIVYEMNPDPMAGDIAALLTFLLSFYFITNKKMRYVEEVSHGLIEISKGNLDHRIQIVGEDEVSSLANNINFMAQQLKKRIDNERKAERTKSELITNVSHDLRTPLTSIKGYLGLIKENKYKEKEQLDEFVNIAYNKTEKLEVLINDLFEYTKLSGSEVGIDKQNIALNGLLDQLIDELSPISEESDVVITEEFINEKVVVNIDPAKTVRVFENLLINAIRYSIKPGEIKVILTKERDVAVVSVQNKCDNLTEEDLDKIFDRFYRAEKSRSSDTGGSGLGLAIAKSIVQLQGGWIEAKYKNGYVSFNVRFRIINDEQ